MPLNRAFNENKNLDDSNLTDKICLEASLVLTLDFVDQSGQKTG